MSGWITDRLAFREDADIDGDVVILDEEQELGYGYILWHEVTPNDAWACCWQNPLD